MTTFANSILRPRKLLFSVVITTLMVIFVARHLLAPEPQRHYGTEIRIKAISNKGFSQTYRSSLTVLADAIQRYPQAKRYVVFTGQPQYIELYYDASRATFDVDCEGGPYTDIIGPIANVTRADMQVVATQGMKLSDLQKYICYERQLGCNTVNQSR